MSGSIYIASKDVVFGIDTDREHAYLVFDTDGLLSTLDDQYFISGFPEFGGDDVIFGRDGDDTINGGTGSDILEGGSGVDALYGGLDADTFMFMAATAFNELDLIKDFVKETAPGDAEDIIDIKDLLIGYNGTAAAITNFLMMTTDGADTLVSVDRDGTGTAYAFGQIARIEGVTGLEDEQALYVNGNLAA